MNLFRWNNFPKMILFCRCLYIHELDSTNRLCVFGFIWSWTQWKNKTKTTESPHLHVYLQCYQVGCSVVPLQVRWSSRQWISEQPGSIKKRWTGQWEPWGWSYYVRKLLILQGSIKLSGLWFCPPPWSLISLLDESNDCLIFFPIKCKYSIDVIKIV